MRRMVVAWALLALLLGGCLADAWYARRLTGGMIAQLEQAQEAASEGRWGQALDLTRQAGGRWADNDFYLHVFMRHADTDQILLTMRSVEQAILLEEADQYATSNAMLITQLELLAEMEQPSLTNVL